MIAKSVFRGLAILVIAGAVLAPTIVSAEPAAAAQAALCKDQTFKLGSKGKCVNYLQIILNAYGLGSGSDSGDTTVDGIFGGRTEELVKRFQTKWAISSDGIVGPNTWRKLCYTGGSNQNAGQVFAGCVVGSRP